MKIKLLFVAVALCVNFYGFAQNFVRDTDFGADGRVLTSFGVNEANLNSLALQPDGKILACGSYMTYTPGPFPVNNKIAVARYNADGTLDASFGDEGKVLVPVGGEVENQYNDLKLLADGKILIRANSFSVTGTIPFHTTHYDLALVRLNPDGSLDTGFDSDGIKIIVFDDSQEAYTTDIQPDNKIIIGGYNYGPFTTNGYPNFAITRLLPDGSNDTGFGTNGQTSINFGSIGNPGFISNDKVQAVKVQPDGKILAAGFTHYQTSYHWGVVRLNSDGTIDTDFGTNGKVFTDFAGGEAFTPQSIELLPGGKFIVTGIYFYNDDANEKIAIAQYNADGSLDNSYGIGGKVVVDNGNPAPVVFSFGSKLLPDGKLLLLGSDINAHDAFILRLNVDGSKDNTFGNNGFVYTGFDEPEAAFDLLVLPDGKMVLGGITGYEDSDNVDFTLWRFEEEALSNAAFGKNKFSVYPNPFTDCINVNLDLKQQETVTVGLFDLSGRMISQPVDQKIFSHQRTIRLDWPELPNGVYLLQITAGKTKETIKIVK